MPLKHTVQEITLKSGAKGLMINVPDSTVMSYTISFRAGNDYVKDPAKHQTAHLMEHMAFGPNEQFTSLEAFSQELNRNGAYANASTFDTNMNYYSDCAQFEWERILQLQELAITKPTFLPEILEAEKGNVREELTGQLHNNGRQLWMHMNRAMGGHSMFDEEKIATINPVTVEDIIEHHKRTHTHKNMRFVLAGNFEGQEQRAIELLEGWKLPRGERFEPTQEVMHASPPVSLKRQDQENITFAFTMLIKRQLSPSELMMSGALGHLLTGTFHSRIFGKARQRGICYGVGSNVSTDLNGTSSWDFHGQVRPDNAVELYELIRDEIRRVAAGDVTDEDIESDKQFLMGDYQMRGQTVSALANWYESDYFFDETIDRIDNISEHIAAIVKEDLIALAREFVDARIWTLGEVGAVTEAETKKHYDVLAPLFGQ